MPAWSPRPAGDAHSEVSSLVTGFGNVNQGSIESAIVAVADRLADEEVTVPGTEPLGRHEFAITMGRSAVTSPDGASSTASTS
jgi:hypothetical protein